MNAAAAHWQRLEALFHAAQAVPAAQREAWLQRECDGDPALLRQARELLAQDTGPGPATAAVARAAASAVHAQAVAEQGRVIGAWRIVAPLGSGGMGSVFLAERDDGAYRSRVALKRLNPWLVGSALEQRFGLERQILSDLAHPHIAALLDGGVSGDGVPYLVMEYVDGAPITQFAADRHLPIDARLRLFLPVCEAVQYAHQNLVIHRDLKPGNVFVTRDGVPKLLDFGIAKLLRPNDAAPEADAQNTRYFTPEYASPEQRAQGTVTTASDVFSLGVLLYELLVGRRPADPSDPAATRPSSALLRSATQPTDNFGAPQRQRWAQRLRGDLDTIVLKALALEPAHRYATPQQLADDLGRFLRSEPVLARPDSWRYRSVKFVRRHRLGVALGSLAVGAILASAVALGVLALHLRDERDRSAQARARAEQEALAAQRVSAFLERLFDGANPNPTQGAAPTLRDVLDRGAQEVGERLADDPVVQARLQVLMANAYRQLGEFAKGIAVAERAVALRRGTVPADPAALAESLDSLGELRRSNGDYAPAENLHREALDLRRQSVPPDPLLLGRSLNNLALTLAEGGDAAGALPLYQEALSLRRRAFGDAAPPVITTLVNLGLLHYTLGNFAASEAAFREAYTQRVKALGEEHLSTANAMTHLGRALALRGAVGEAEPLLRRALEVRRKLLGPRGADVSISLYELAALLYRNGSIGEAERLLREAHAIDLERFGPDHTETAPALERLGEVLLAKGRLDEAERCLRDAVRIGQTRLAKDHPRLAASKSRLADALLARGKFDEAGRLYREALSVQRAKLWPGHGDIVRTLLGMARLARAQGDMTTAVALADECAALLARSPLVFDDERRRLDDLRAQLGGQSTR